jgi:hypothetical protein
MSKVKEVEQQRKEAEAKAELFRKRYLHDLEQVVKTAAGKRIMIYLLERAGIMNQVMVPSEQDRSYLNEGRRLFGLMLLQDLAQADPENFNMPVMRYKYEEQK